MDEKKRKRLIYIAFVGAIIFAVVYFSPGKEKKPVAQNDYPTAAPIQAGQQSSTTIDYEEYESLDWGADPFARHLSVIAQQADIVKQNKTYQLGGILYGELNSSAIINGNIRGVGESINEAKIIEILKDRVTLINKNGKKIYLSLPEDKS